MYQNGGWFNGPNDEYDQALGYKRGYRTSTRDLPMEMADALAKRNISMFIYVTAQPPCCDANAQRTFGFSTGLDDQKYTLEAAEKWNRVLRWWSIHYGEKVAGWWGDASYPWRDFNEEIAALYREGLRAGNPNAVVAFNSGVKGPEWLTSDYTAGEVYEPFDETGTDFSREENRATQKGHILTFLGEDWGVPGLRSYAELWIPWGQNIAATGTALTFDLGLNSDGDKPGYFSEEALAVVRAVAGSVDGENASENAAEDGDE